MIHRQLFVLRRLAAFSILIVLLMTFVIGSNSRLRASPLGQDPYPSPIQNIEPYPAPGDAPVFTTAESPGTTTDQSQIPALSATETQTVNSSMSGLIFLWLGFIATFLIFVAAIIGSILLFTRRNER